MFYEVIDRAEAADITVDGVYLRKFEPDAETEKRVLDEASQFVLTETTVELNRHVCYNHLTDYSWNRESPIEDHVVKDGRFFGALVTGEDEFEFGRGLRTVPFAGVLLADGRRLGKTYSEFLYNASAYGRSCEIEYELLPAKGE